MAKNKIISTEELFSKEDNGIISSEDLFGKKSSQEILSTEELLSPQAAQSVKPETTATYTERAQDVGVSLLKGAISLPESYVGLADITTGGRAGKFLKDVAGFDPKRSKEMLNEIYSPAQKEASTRVGKSKGIIDKAVAVLSNPSVITQAIAESAPSMIGAAAAGRGLLKLAPKILPKLASKITPVAAAAAGEGAISAGSLAEQVRQDEPSGRLSGRQSAIAGVSGAATGMLGALGGKIAKKLGIADIDVLLTAGYTALKAQKNLVKMVIYGAFEEGILEELPQSVQEQIAQNAATKQPLDQGVDSAAVFGTLVGAAMGGGVQAVTSFGSEKGQPVPAPKQAPLPDKAPIVPRETPTQFDKTDILNDFDVPVPKSLKTLERVQRESGGKAVSSQELQDAKSEISDRFITKDLGIWQKQFVFDAKRKIDGKKLIETPLINMDIDNLKQLNTDLGHTGADSLMKGAMILAKKHGFSPVRLGGDEFALVINPKGEKSSPYEVMDRFKAFQEEASRLTVTNREGVEHKGITFSSGFGVGEKAADLMSLKAKESGKSRIVLDKNFIDQYNKSEGTNYEWKTLPTKTQDPNLLEARVGEAVPVEGPGLGIEPGRPAVEPTPAVTPEQSLIQEARKYKSAEEFVYAEKTIPIDMVSTPVSREQIIKAIGKIESKHPNDPVAVRFKNGKIVIRDGNNRYYQKIDLGEKTINVVFTPENDAQLTDIWNKAQSQPKKQPTRPIKLPPIAGTGKVETRGLSENVEAMAISKNLTEGFGGLPEYKTVNMKEQALAANDIMSQDYEQAKRIAMGLERPPPNVIPESLFVAVEGRAIKEGDVATLRDLAINSRLATEATTMGQRIRTLAERDPNSPAGAMANIAKIREDMALKRLGEKDLAKAKKDTVRDIEFEIKRVRPKRETWISFVNSLRC